MNGLDDFAGFIAPIFFRILNALIPFIIFFSLFIIFKKVYHHFKTQKFVSGIKWALLEIRVPRDIQKSPKAMEFIFSNALYQATGKGFWEEWISGTARMYFSLEIVSIGGQVHFYVRTPTRMRQLLESQIYAQYPQSEIVEVEDYALKVGDIEKDGEWKSWGCEFALENHDAYPIKTYVDWEAEELDEEEGLDPITAVIEYLGSIKPTEQIWIQMVVRATQKKYKIAGSFGKHQEFNDEVEAEHTRLMQPFTAIKLDEHGHETSREIRTPDVIKTKLEGLNKKRSKLCFDVGIRAVYVAPANAFQVDTYKGLRLMFRQYGNPNVNSLVRVVSTQIENPWEENIWGTSVIKMKNHMLHNYRVRNFFYPGIRESVHWMWPLSTFFPNHPPHISVLNTEELATIFHFPGRLSKTPSFTRVESRKAEPPANLPV